MTTKVFATMRGEDILSYVRDTVRAVATTKRSFAEQSAVVGGTPLSKEELAELAALDAAGDIIQFAVSAGQEAKTTPEWVLRMVAQARAALVAEKELDEA